MANEKAYMNNAFLHRVNPKSEFSLLLFLAVLSFLIQLWAIFSELDMLGNDDAYYYFQVAKNFPKIHQFSFDGIHLTNGVQPLYVIILCLFSWILSPFSLTPENLAKAFYTINAVFNIGAALIFFRWGRALGGKIFGWLLFIFFAYGSFTIRKQLTGMENSLYAMMLGLCLPKILAILERSEKVRVKKAFVVGLLGGLLFLTRVDSIFFILIIAVWMLIKNRKYIISAINEIIIIGCASLATVFPYLVYNKVFLGHLFPISGAVKLFYSKQNALTHFGGMFTLKYINYVGRKLLSLPDKMISNVTESIKSWFLGSPYFLQTFYESLNVKLKIILFILPGLILITLVLFGWFRVSREAWLMAVKKFLTTLRPAIPVFVFAVIQLLVTSFMYPQYVQYSGVDWWYIPSYISITFIVLALLGGLMSMESRFRKRDFWKLTVLGILIALNSAGYIHTKLIKRQMAPDIHFQNAKYFAATWINDNLPEDAIIGSWNAGIVGYYSDRVVVNLDGLVNDFEYLEALKNKNIYQYLRNNNIRYIADYMLGKNNIPKNKFRKIPISRVIYTGNIDSPQKSIYVICEVDFSSSLQK